MEENEINLLWYFRYIIVYLLAIMITRIQVGVVDKFQYKYVFLKYFKG